MERALCIVLCIIVSSLIVISVADSRNVAIESNNQSAVVLEGVNTIPGDFYATGTLTFYPNNVGPVPYLFYQNENKSTVARALVFPNSPPTNFSSWSGAHVSVTGKLNQEHIVVTRLIYLSAP